MSHDVNEYEVRAAECERLAFATVDLVLREDMLSLCRIYRDYAGHLKDRSAAQEWPQGAYG